MMGNLPLLVSLLIASAVLAALLPPAIWKRIRMPALDHMVLNHLQQGRVSWLDRLQVRLVRSGAGINVAQYLLCTGISGLAAYVCCGLILQSWWLALPALMMGLVCSERLVSMIGTKRRERFEEGNIRALRIMASSLRTSPSYLHAFEQVATSPFVDPRIAGEYQRLVDLLRGQVPLERVMKDFYMRTGSPDIGYLSMIVQVQRELGGDMAKTLDQAASSLLRRKQLMRKRRAALMQILAQVNLLTVMPFVFVLILFIQNPHHFDPLLSTISGRLSLLGAFASILFGGELIRFAAMRQLRRGNGG